MVSPFVILITTQQTSCKPTAKHCYARSKKQYARGKLLQCLKQIKVKN